MEVLLAIPPLNLETVKMFLEKHKLTPSTLKLNRTHSIVPDKSLTDITVVKMKLESNSTRSQNSSQLTLTADINEMMEPTVTNSRGRAVDRKHVIQLEFTGKEQNISSAICSKCSAANVKCTAISAFLCLIQYMQRETKHEKKQSKAEIEENPPKKRMVTRECRVLLERVDIYNYIPKPVLKKLSVETVSFTSNQLEKASSLSMVQMIQEFKGDDADKFLSFCTDRMKSSVCDNIALITIGQADTKLWHELRIGRITASRIREAARCTMLNGSLLQKIMGVSSGFSLAIKRGNDLEGHVLAELRKEYPELRNVGLMLNPSCPWMGASPDGICDEFVLEIKCPYTARTHACYVDLETLSPKYFAQIQLQMHIAKRTKALLAVAATDFESTKQITKLWIDYDKTYVNDVIEHAFDYWRKAVFKALLRKRKK